MITLPNIKIHMLIRMRRQAERWGAELFHEDVEHLDLRKRPFTVRSSEREVIISFLSKSIGSIK